MSHTVTVTRTITTSSTTGVLINTGYLKTWQGILKLFQTILGIVVVGIVSYYYGSSYKTVPELFMLLMSVTFLVGTFLLLISCLMSLTMTSITRNTHEVIYHGAAFILYLAASLTFLVELNNRKSYYRSHYEAYMAAAIIGLVISALYLLSTVFASRSYRGF